MTKTFLISLLTATVTFQALADTYYVRPDGNDQANGLTKTTPLKTLQQAARAVNAGDQIVLAPGRYGGGAVIAERFAADGAALTIAGDESGKLTGTAPGAVVIEADDASTVALHLYRCRAIKVSGLTFRGSGQGLKIGHCQDVLVERCSFEGLSDGLAIANSTGVKVQSCVAARCTIGLFLRNLVDTRVAHVTVAHSTSAGLVALQCGPGMVVNSIFAGNNTSLVADEISAANWSSDHNVLQGACGTWGEVPTVANPYEWTAASDQDRHSIYVAPAFRDPEHLDLHIAPQVTWPGGLPGMNVGVVLDNLGTDRDGKPFRVRDSAVCAGAYDYPDPQPAAGWRALPVKPIGAGPRQSAALFREDGTLVRTLLADVSGVRELWWDGLDDTGQVAPADSYQLKTLTHDVRIRDDGSVGDNGSPLGQYNVDNASCIAALPDGGFLVATEYDEAGFAVRRYSSSGQPIFASNHAEKNFYALASQGEEVYGIVGATAAAKLVRLVLPGERTAMLNGADAYSLGIPDDKTSTVAGVAFTGQTAYAAIRALNLIRVVDLASGQKRADFAVPNVGDVAVDAAGTLWAISGADVVALTADGMIAKRFPTTLAAPTTLAVGKDRLAVVDRTAAKVAILDMDGRVVRTLGKERGVGVWPAVGSDILRDPRGCAFLTDGRLAVAEQKRIRVLWPDTGVISQDIVSSFVDTAVSHPTRPEYVYTSLGCFRVDPATGAWRWMLEEPRGLTVTNKEGKLQPEACGYPIGAVVLGGRPFVAYTPFIAPTTLRLYDVSDPLQPTLALAQSGLPGAAWYYTMSFGKNGDLLLPGDYQGPRDTLTFKVIKFQGLDAQQRPQYDFAHPTSVGVAKDPVNARNMRIQWGLAQDKSTGDIFYLATTAYNNKMVPGWGADGTGIGKSSSTGAPCWFAPSSGGNYMAMDAVSDGKRTWVLAAKSFGGQIDLFDTDGLRLTTGTWGWPSHWQFGFVDVRFGLRAYLRPDGKIGAWVEDDAIGRLGRARVDNLASVKSTSTPLAWTPTSASKGVPPVASRTQGAALAAALAAPRTPELPMNGDWAAWTRAGITPQIVTLPVPSFARFMPDDLWQTFREGTAIGAVAHDDKNIYCYFVVTDDSMHFDADLSPKLALYDCIELWIEEEQFALGFLKDGTPVAHKYRHHNLDGKPFAANYVLPRENVWGLKLDDVGAHPLGRLLSESVGVSLANRKGYALMVRIPYSEVYLVGGIAGRTGTDILKLTGAPGEIVRIGANFSGVVAKGREQDFKMGWPVGIMFADPTRSVPFTLGQ